MMLVHKGFQGQSLLALAALRGNKDTFQAVLITIGTRLHTQNVRHRYLVCDAAHGRLNVRPSLIAWRIAVLLFSTPFH